jgi:hypothetical protein
MTADEWADAAVREIEGFVPLRRAAGCEPYHPDQMRAIFAGVVRAAVLAEREAVARQLEAERRAWTSPVVAEVLDTMAAAIRARPAP